MKIIQVDNYDREGSGYDDTLVCEGLDDRWGNKILDALCRDERDTNFYYRLVSDEYKLKKFEP